jgi:hypothetical protein
MGTLSRKLRKWGNPANGDEGLTYWCQGCQMSHSIKTRGAGSWGWNGNAERPTFTPSVLVTWPANPDASEEFKEWRTERRCHTFITDGRVQFLQDCTHELVGQTLDLPDLPDHMRDDNSS